MKFVPVDCDAFLWLWPTLVICSYITLFSFSIKYLQGAVCLARSLKVVNEVLTELDLGFNEIRVKNCSFIGYSFTNKQHLALFYIVVAYRMTALFLLLKHSRLMKM